MTRPRLTRALSWLALGALGGVLVPSVAAAKPSIWEAARDPDAALSERSFEASERMFARAIEAERMSPRSAANLQRAALALADLAEKHGSPELDYFLGHLLSQGRDLKRAESVLRRALRRAPDSPLARRAWFDLGIIRAKQGDGAGEHAAYTRALETSWERGLRANLLLNRGESNMVAGDLSAALLDYREAARLANEPSLQALAYWGIAIAEERQGDLPQALAAAKLASTISPGALDLPSVFFVPRYDVFYYRALTWMALAKDASGLAARADGYRRADLAWAAYLVEAEPAKARWVVNAQLHQASVKKQLRAAEAELAKQLAAAKRAKPPRQ